MRLSPTPRLIFKVASRNVRRNIRHSAAALATMAVGFLALALFQGYIEDFLQMQLDTVYSRMMVGDILVQRPRESPRAARMNPDTYWMPEPEQQFLERWLAAHPGDVKTRVRTLIIAGMAHAGGSSAQMIAWGHDIPEGRLARRGFAWNTWAGHPVKDDEPTGANLGLALGAILGCDTTADPPPLDGRTGHPLPVEREFHCKQNTITLTSTGGRGRQNALEADVVGLTRAIARDFDEMLLWMPLGFVQDLAGTRSVSQYMIMLKNPEDAPRLRAELSAAAKQAGFNLEVADWMDTDGADLLRRGIDLLSVFRGLVFIVILIIAGAAVLTTMMKSVRERTREIGTLRSIGYLRRHLLAIFAVEAGILGVYAAVLGLALAAASTTVINISGITYKGGLLSDAIPLRVGYSPAAYAWGFVFLSAVAVVAALIAARKVTAMSIAEALSEG